MKMFWTVVLSTASLAGVFMSTATVAQAEDLNVCAAVVPCNFDGTVAAPFNQGECAPQYARICQSELVNRMGSDLAACSNKSEDLNKQLAKALKENAKLKKKLARGNR